MKFSRITIPATNVVSLTWYGDTLVDWVRGGARFHLHDGTCEESRVSWAFPFDMACATKDGRFAVIYQRLGTKALLLRDGKLLRELNRSYYHAHVYEYPVCLWRASDGRTLLAHCPEDYCRIEIDDAESGIRLTEGLRKPDDFFHSRLLVNSSGTHLLSAGWAWQPWDGVAFYDVAEALHDPTHLDKLAHRAPGSLNAAFAEESSACWQTTARVLLGASSQPEDHDHTNSMKIGEPCLHPRGVAVTTSSRALASAPSSSKRLPEP